MLNALLIPLGLFFSLYFFNQVRLAWIQALHLNPKESSQPRVSRFTHVSLILVFLLAYFAILGTVLHELISSGL